VNLADLKGLRAAAETYARDPRKPINAWRIALCLSAPPEIPAMFEEAFHDLGRKGLHVAALIHLHAPIADQSDAIERRDLALHGLARLVVEALTLAERMEQPS